MWPVPFSVERAWSRIASQPILEQVEIFLLAPYRNTFRFRSEIQFIATTNHPTEYTLHMWIMFFLDNKTQLLSTMILAGGRGIVQMGQIAKSRPKLDFFKNREIDWLYLWVTVWRILKIKGEHSPETEMINVALKKSWNHNKQTEVTSFWRVFIIWTAGVSKKAQVERHEIISCACS